MPITKAELFRRQRERGIVMEYSQAEKEMAYIGTTADGDNSRLFSQGRKEGVLGNQLKEGEQWQTK